MGIRPIYFASGLAGEGKISGFAAVGINVGVTVNHLHRGDEVLLSTMAGSGALVFVDSGAFGEVSFDNGVRTVKDPIDHGEWCRRLDIYRRLAVALGPQLYAVAPDAVGDQDETLIRLARYADRVREFAALGANVIVPHQVGQLTLSEFGARAKEILGIDFIAGLPSKKSAVSPGDLFRFLDEARPKRVHFLGAGLLSRRWPALESVVRSASPGTEISCDSVALLAIVGRGRGVRPLTMALDAATDEIADYIWSEGLGDVPDYTEAIFDPDSWVPPSVRVALVSVISSACLLNLSTDEVRQIASSSVSGWLAEIEINDWVEAILDRFWADHAHRVSTPWREKRAIAAVFGDTARGRALRGEEDDFQFGLFDCA